MTIVIWFEPAAWAAKNMFCSTYLYKERNVSIKILLHKLEREIIIFVLLVRNNLFCAHFLGRKVSLFRPKTQLLFLHQWRKVMFYRGSGVCGTNGTLPRYTSFPPVVQTTFFVLLWSPVITKKFQNFRRNGISQERKVNFPPAYYFLSK